MCAPGSGSGEPRGCARHAAGAATVALRTQDLGGIPTEAGAARTYLNEAGAARTYLNEALRFFGDCVAALRVWGAGGVGKTTMLKLVCEVCGRVACFHHVLLIAASKDYTVAKLQR